MSNLQVTKGSNSVTIHTVEVTEDFSNKLNFIRPPQTVNKQDLGAKDTKVIDLLIITHTLVCRGHINKTATKTAKEVKDDLVTILKGSGEKGGPCTVSWDGDSLNMYLEKMTVIKKPSGQDTATQDVITYDVQITLVEGVKI